MQDDIRDWLDSLGLVEHAPAFKANRIDWDILADLTSDDLRDMGVAAIGDRRRLLKAIAERTTDGGKAREASITPAPDASRRQVTVLFADLVGFTSLTSRMDAEDVHALLNRYFAAVDAAVVRYGGRIDKHIGDAVMAVFGAPVAHTNDPERAVRAALDIHAAVARLDPPLNAHVGVASGQVVASATGSDAHAEYTVTGDGVNLAARLTDLAGRDETFVSEPVKLATGDLFEAEADGVRPIKGLDAPIEVWRVLGLAERIGASERLVGRDAELDRIAAVLRGCRYQQCAAVIVLRGDPGIGKSRLLAEIGNLPEAKGFARRRCAILDFGGAADRSLSHALAREFLDLDADAGADARMAASQAAVESGTLPSSLRGHLNALLDLPAPPEHAQTHAALDTTARTRGRRAALSALVTASTTPLLIEVEDVHWATAQDLEDVAQVAASAGETAATFILTTRRAEDPLDAAWASQLGGVAWEKIDLTPLDAADALTIVEASGSVDAGVVEKCVTRAGGNPLFLHQLLRNADRLDVDDLPDSIQGIVQARLDVLPARARSAVQAASVLGQRFPRDALDHLLAGHGGLPRDPFDAGLLIDSGEEVKFSHALIRDGAYESLLRSARRAHHGQAAAWFASRDLTLHARHLDRADAEGAPEAYLAAAQQRMKLFEADRARPLLERALELECLAETRFDLTCALGEVLRAVGESDAATARFADAVAAATTDPQRVRAHVGLAQVARQASRYAEAMGSLDAAQSAAERLASDADLAQIHYLRGNLYFPLGRMDDMIVSTERALSYAEAAHSVAIQVGGNSNFGDANYMKGAMLTSDRYYSHAIDLARAEGLSRDLAANLHNRAAARIHTDSRRAIEDAEESLAVARRCFAPVAECVALASLSCARLLTGDLDASLHAAQENARVAREVGAQRFEAQALGYRTRLLFLLDRVSEARETGEQAVELSLAVARNFSSPKELSALALTLGDPDTQDELLHQGSEILAEGCVSHCHFFFYADAIRISLCRRAWDRALGYAANLDRFVRDEPLPMSTLVIRQTHMLVEAGQKGRRSPEPFQLEEFRADCQRLGVAQTFSGLSEVVPV